MSRDGIERRIAAIDWPQVSTDLDAQGWAILPALLSPAEAESIANLYDQEAGFRSRVVMARHGFGQGEYRYFSYPLPDLVQSLRTSAYPPLAPIANRWQARLGKDLRFPDDHAAFLVEYRSPDSQRHAPAEPEPWLHQKQVKTTGHRVSLSRAGNHSKAKQNETDLPHLSFGRGDASNPPAKRSREEILLRCQAIHPRPFPAADSAARNHPASVRVQLLRSYLSRARQ